MGAPAVLNGHRYQGILPGTGPQQRARRVRVSSEVQRSPDQVMRLARLGAFHHSRLSFMRVLLRRLRREQWQFDRPVWRLDSAGVGHAVYRARGPERTYSLVCFGHDLPDAQRSDRVIATAWDATFVLFDGEPTHADLDRLAAQVPRQEAGRLTGQELCLSRANRSVRIFEHVVGRLAQGEQPDPAIIAQVGYLMRTTAVYGFGKFGTADREAMAARAELRGPFRAEMLTVYLIRWFSIDLVAHLARARGGEQAVTLDAKLCRQLGIGNSTGLGMAPFLITHPILLNNWIQAREVALGRVLKQQSAAPDAQARFRRYLAKAQANAAMWHTSHAEQQAKIEVLRAELGEVEQRITEGALDGASPWVQLYRWAEDTLSLEGQEQIVSLLLEAYPELVDELAECMDANEDEGFAIDDDMAIGELRAMIDDYYAWALTDDYEQRSARARFWYVSEEKLEPRLGERFEEPGAERELPLGIGRDVVRLAQVLEGETPERSVWDFAMAKPELRHVIRRVQRAPLYPYGEIRDNLLSAELMPIDLLRCKLSFFGAVRFDPRSDRWVRICMYQDAPLPFELVPPMETADEGQPPAPAVNARRRIVVRPVSDGVTCALAEIEALGRKASRGAGGEWGEAEEAGRAAWCLASHGLRGPELLQEILEEAVWVRDAMAKKSEPRPREVGRRLETEVELFIGPLIGQRTLQTLARGPTRRALCPRPAFLLPYFCAALAGTERAVRLSWQGAEVVCYGEGMTVVHAEGLYEFYQGDKVLLELIARPVEINLPGCQPYVVERQVWQRLQELAAETYVPATEASRHVGAGAGTNDADQLE